VLEVDRHEASHGMMSVVDLDGCPGGLRDPVPRRSKARRGADRLVRDASHA
jgi:hypothetical protein